MEKPALLIVEDDEALCVQYRYALRDEFTLRFAGNRLQAIKQFNEEQPAAIMLDLGLPPHAATPEEGLGILKVLLDLDPSAKVVVVTGNNDRANALRAVQNGAFDYHLKPANIDDLRVVLRRAAYLRSLEAELQPSGNGTGSVRFEGILGTTPKMLDLFTTLAQVAKTDATVLIQGESGTGKELAARAIHARSVRRQGPFVAINCGAIPETLLESELFGAERGAYTGAHAQRKGKLELAQGGTLFLDEIGEMSLPLQVKLLRFLQERRLERVGGRESITVDTRVIAATNKELKTEIQAGRFREDVFYRLSVVVLTMPPLRDRGEDLILLANTFLRKSCEQHGRRLRFSGQALEAIAAYAWPGNVRELENAAQRAVIMARARFVEPADLGIAATAQTAVSARGVIMARARFIEPADLGIEAAVRAPASTLREARNHTERQMVVDALTRWQGNISRAARELGISRPAFHDLLNKHRVVARRFRWSFVKPDSGDSGDGRTATVAP